jgi:hypothetical protein
MGCLGVVFGGKRGWIWVCFDGRICEFWVIFYLFLQKYFLNF